MSDAISSRLRSVPSVVEFAGEAGKEIVALREQLARAEFAARTNAETIASMQKAYAEEVSALHATIARQKKHAQSAILVWLFENFDDIVVDFDGRAVTLSHLFDCDERRTLGCAVDMVVAQIADGRHAEGRDFWPLCKNCNVPDCSTGCDEHGKKYPQEARFDLSKVIG